MTKKWLFTFVFTIGFFSGFSQKAVYQLPISSENVISNPTFFYALPKTVIKVDVTVTKVTETRGLYADYAEKLLGIKDVCKENKTNYKLKDVKVSSLTIPDENLQYVVELSANQVKTNFLLDLNQRKIATETINYAELQKPITNTTSIFNPFVDVISTQTSETYTETKIINGVVTQVPVSQTKTVTKTTAQQAQEAADFIEKIKTNRYEIISCSQEVAYTKDAFEFVVNQLNNLEKQYLELFLGTQMAEESSVSYLLIPNPDYGTIPAFSVSPSAGVSASMTKTNAHNYYLKIETQLSNSQRVTFNETVASKPKYVVPNGFRIRKSVPAFVKLIHGDTEEMNFGSFPIYQYGIIETIPALYDTFDIRKWGFLF